MPSLNEDIERCAVFGSTAIKCLHEADTVFRTVMCSF